MVVESPPRRGAGDYAISVAFRIAKAVGMAPYEVARVLRDGLDAARRGARAWRSPGAGFLNVTLDDLARAALVEELLEQGDVPARRAVGARRSTVERRASIAPDSERGPAADGTPALLDAVPDATTGVQSAPPCASTRTPAPAGAVSTTPHRTVRRLPQATVRTRRAAAVVRDQRTRASLALLADHRRIGEQADPARQARHLVAVGDAFFDFQEQCPPLPSGDEKPGAAHRARLALVEATGAVLAGGLSQLGVTAPAHL